MAGVDRYRDSEVDPVLRQIASAWIQKIRLAEQHKIRVFGNAAAECANFYDGPRSWDEAMIGGTSEGVVGAQPSDNYPQPDFKVCVNKTFEFESIFGPA